MHSLYMPALMVQLLKKGSLCSLNGCLIDSLTTIGHNYCSLPLLGNIYGPQVNHYFKIKKKQNKKSVFYCWKEPEMNLSLVITSVCIIYL